MQDGGIKNILGKLNLIAADGFFALMIIGTTIHRPFVSTICYIFDPDNRPATGCAFGDTTEKISRPAVFICGSREQASTLPTQVCLVIVLSYGFNLFPED